VIEETGGGPSTQTTDLRQKIKVPGGF